MRLNCIWNKYRFNCYTIDATAVLVYLYTLFTEYFPAEDSPPFLNNSRHPRRQYCRVDTVQQSRGTSGIELQEYTYKEYSTHIMKRSHALWFTVHSLLTQSKYAQRSGSCYAFCYMATYHKKQEVSGTWEEHQFVGRYEIPKHFMAA